MKNLEEDYKATDTEWVNFEVSHIGENKKDQAWILHDRDVYVVNPHWEGPRRKDGSPIAVHPEYDEGFDSQEEEDAWVKREILIDKTILKVTWNVGSDDKQDIAWDYSPRDEEGNILF